MITNNYNLPQKIVDLIEADNYKYTENRYSATEILNSTKEIILKRRYHKVVITDVSDHVNKLFGTAFHTLFDIDSQSEVKVEHTLNNGVTMSGRVDDVRDNILTDYKTCSVYKITAGDFSDWEKQCLIYAWLLSKQGIFVEKIRVIAFIKDWSATRKQVTSNYPESQIYVYELNVSNFMLQDTESWVIKKTNELTQYKNVPNNELPEPSDEELWKTPDVFALMKHGRKSAVKLYDNLEEAQAQVISDDFYIDHRIGEYKKLIVDKELGQIWKIAESQVYQEKQ